MLGILSDSHDRVNPVIRAIQLLRGRGADHFLHCGDVGSERILDHFAALALTFVTGNTDYDRHGLLRYGKQLGLAGFIPAADVTLDGKRIAMTHGDDGRLLHQLIASQQYDYVFHGHTHVRRDEKEGRTRIINPGALHRAATKTVALLDTQADLLEFLTVV